MSQTFVHLVDSDYAELHAMLVAITIQNQSATATLDQLIVRSAHEPEVDQPEVNQPQDKPNALHPAHICLEYDALMSLAEYGIEPSVLLAELGATAQFSDLLYTDAQTSPHFVSRSPMGAILQGVEFHHLLNLLKLNTNDGLDPSLQSYSLNNQLTAHEAFCMPSRNPEDIASTIEFGISISVSVLLHYLKERLNTASWITIYREDFELRRVELVTPKYSSREIGRICELVLLTSQLLIKTSFVFDYRALANSDEAGQADYSYAIGTIETPLPKQIFINKNAVLQTLGDQCSTTLEFIGVGQHTLSNVKQKFHDIGIDTNKLDSIQIEACQIPQVQTLWTHNVLNMQPLLKPKYLGASLQHTPCIRALEIWLQHFPSEALNHALIKAANESLDCYVDNLYGYLCLPLRNVLPIEQSQQYLALAGQKKSLFEGTGTIYLSEQDPFAQHQWVNLFLAMGVWPSQQDVLASGLPNAQLLCERMSQKFSDFARNQPTFNQVLERQSTGATHAG